MMQYKKGPELRGYVLKNTEEIRVLLEDQQANL